MATVTVQLSNICPGGGHGKLAVTGNISRFKHIDFSDFIDKVQSMDDEDVLAALVKIAKIGRTNAQLKTLLQSSFTVTI